MPNSSTVEEAYQKYQRSVASLKKHKGPHFPASLEDNLLFRPVRLFSDELSHVFEKSISGAWEPGEDRLASFLGKLDALEHEHEKLLGEDPLAVNALLDSIYSTAVRVVSDKGLITTEEQIKALEAIVRQVDERQAKMKPHRRILNCLAPWPSGPPH